MSTPMYAPAPNQQFVARDGSVYTSGANNLLTPTPTVNDIVDLLNLGCKFNPMYIRKFGTFTANGASAVTIADAAVAITDLYVFSLNTVGGTVGAHPHLLTLTPSSQVTVSGTASDTSVYNYAVWSQA